MYKLGPKPEKSPSIGKPCPICGIVFKAGDVTTLLEGGYRGMGLETHYRCQEDPSDDWFTPHEEMVLEADRLVEGES